MVADTVGISAIEDDSDPFSEVPSRIRHLQATCIMTKPPRSQCSSALLYRLRTRRATAQRVIYQQYSLYTAGILDRYAHVFDLLDCDVPVESKAGAVVYVEQLARRIVFS